MIDLHITRPAPQGEHRNWEVTIDAKWTEDDTDAKIFVMRDASAVGSPPDFSCVSSAIQLLDIPEDESGDESSYFRTASVTVSFLRAYFATEFVDKVEYAVSLLVDDIAAAAEQGTTTITIIPDA
jgi:hypothetical protein